MHTIFYSNDVMYLLSKIALASATVAEITALSACEEGGGGANGDAMATATKEPYVPMRIMAKKTKQPQQCHIVKIIAMPTC